MLEVHEHGKVTRYHLCQPIGGRPVYWVNVYQVGSLLIDTGCPHTASELIEALQTRPELALLTHWHEDHIGAGQLIQERFRMGLLAHPENFSMIEAFPEQMRYQLVIWGRPKSFKCGPIPDMLRYEGRSYAPVKVAGHSSTGVDVAFWVPDERWLFPGDLFINTRRKTIRRGENPFEIARSLRRLSKLEPKWLFPPHSEPIEDAGPVLREAADYLDECLATIARRNSEGASSAQIMAELYGRESILCGLTEGDVSSLNLVEAALAQARPVKPSGLYH